MKLIVKIAGLNKDDPRYRLMLDKKAELQEFCDEYESILKEPLPQYAIDGVLPTVQIVPTGRQWSCRWIDQQSELFLSAWHGRGCSASQDRQTD